MSDNIFFFQSQIQRIVPNSTMYSRCSTEKLHLNPHLFSYKFYIERCSMLITLSGDWPGFPLAQTLVSAAICSHLPARRCPATGAVHVLYIPSSHPLCGPFLLPDIHTPEEKSSHSNPHLPHQYRHIYLTLEIKEKKNIFWTFRPGWYHREAAVKN